MTKLIAPKGGNDYKPQFIEGDKVDAILFSIIDLGTQEGEYEGKAIFPRKVIFRFETQQMGEFDGVKKPLCVSKSYTLSMNERSRLFADIKSLLQETPKDDFDIMTLMGKAVKLELKINKASNGKTYQNINGIYSGDKPWKLVNSIVKFSLSDFDEDTFDNLTDRQKETIEKSPEYKEILKELQDGKPF